MKSIGTILVLFTLMIQLSFSQSNSFPTDSAVWHYIIYDASGPVPIWHQSTYETQSDTSINGVIYKVVSSSFYGLQFIYRVDSLGKVWGRYLDPSIVSCTDTNELLLYDFTLGLHDTLVIKTCYHDSIVCTVSQIDSISTNHGPRKTLRFDNVPELTCYTSNTMIWIEGFGSYHDLFYNLNFFVPGSVCLHSYALSTVSISGVGHILTSLDEKEIAPQIIVSGNKISSNEIIDMILIYDLSGKIIEKYNVNAYIHTIENNSCFRYRIGYILINKKYYVIKL